MYQPLGEIGDELLVPNLGLVPPNTISLMLTNQPFIEAYMVGLNHEFAQRAAVAGVSDRSARLAVPPVLGACRASRPSRA